jgi:hypothetical protein
MTNLINCQEIADSLHVHTRRIGDRVESSESVKTYAINALLPFATLHLHNKPQTGVHNEFAAHLDLKLFLRGAHLCFRR